MTNSDAEFLVEMKIAPTGSLLTPQEGVAFAERFVLPTLELSRDLKAAGRIVAGGPIAGGMGFAFILRASSLRQVEDIVAGLPLWPRAQTTVVPLTTFEDRAAAVRERLDRVKASLQPPVREAVSA